MYIMREKNVLYLPPTHHQHGYLVTWLQAKNTQTKTALVFNYFCLLLRGQSTTFLWPFRGCLHSRHFLVVFSLLWDCCPVVSGTWETGGAKKKLWLYITNSCSSTYIGKGMTIKKIVQIRRFCHRLSITTVIINWWSVQQWCFFVASSAKPLL